MKTRHCLLTTLCLSIGLIPARAQFYLDGLNHYNNGGIVSYFQDSAIVTAAGNYTAAAGALTMHGGSIFHTDGAYTAGGGSRDSFPGNGSASWPPADAPKTISGSVAPTFDIASFANGAAQPLDITNTGGVNIATSLSFSNGITSTVRSLNSNGALRFANGASYSNSALGDAQYVNGYVSKTGNSAFTFPVGSQAGNDVRTLQISAPGSATDQLSIAYWTGDAAAALDPTPSGTQSRSSLNPAGTAGVDQLVSVSPIGFWDWIAVSGTSSLTVTVSLPEFSGNGGYSSATAVRLVGWNTTTQQWDNLSGSTGASGLTEGSQLTGTVPDMSQYSAIAVGNVLEIPLPLDITAFTGYMDGSCAAHLEWAAANIVGVEKFVIQYGRDGQSYKDAGEVTCSDAPSGQYRFTIENIARGDAFFRLVTRDRDGSIAYHSRIVKLRSECSPEPVLTVTPNPAKDHVIVSGLEPGSSLLLLDAAGHQLQATTAQHTTEQIDLGSYSKGLYFLHIVDGRKNVISKKITKQ